MTVINPWLQVTLPNSGIPSILLFIYPAHVVADTQFWTQVGNQYLHVDIDVILSYELSRHYCYVIGGRLNHVTTNDQLDNIRSWLSHGKYM